MEDNKYLEFISGKIRESADVKMKILDEKIIPAGILKASEIIVNCYLKIPGGRVFLAGNGGSAADAQHIAAELVSRFYKERKGLAAEALNVNTSIMTAIGNDYSFDYIFARQIEANGREGDVFIGLSTSGNSKNILQAVNLCKEKRITVIGFTGASGGMMNNLCDLLIKVPSVDTPRIQESHIMIGHIICELVEKEVFKEII